MSDYVRIPLLALFAACWSVGVIASLVAAVSLVQLPFNARPNSITGWLRFNPLNVTLYADKLTPRGLVIRRRLLVALAVFVSALLAAFATVAVAKLIAPLL